ncbi:conserved Plasmodium protein, unknown function [Plasmodium relictum]|uniref:Uncharacterized protein n=1 Tax=Plasmodium relictum TaxID=85471 RepID=A0A1J1H735_PLARL|nr:conserved Plasmodium protein, unknown function [Plasmodium relictum]CRH00729.1 conserved Plasmodium protein, unknown function [Plasmodium relictum]
MKKRKNKRKINYHEETFTYKNIEKYDEDVIDIDNNFLKVRNKYSSILKKINIYSEKKEKKNYIKELKNDINKITSNIKNELKYVDILICGDKNSGKTTFLNCISCVDHFNSNKYNISLLNDKTNVKNEIKSNKEIIWNYNKLELLSYIPIIFSKFTNRNYDVLKKEFKKNFLDTDICESSIFITADDLSFINYEFNLCSNSFINDFDYIKINFCEYGEDLFRKIKKYYNILKNYNEHLEMKNENEEGGNNKKKYEGIEICDRLWETNKNIKKLFSSYNIRNIIETALLRIKETKYINYFINLKKCFLLIKSSKLIYNILIEKEFKKSKNNLKIKKKNKVTFNSLLNNMYSKNTILIHDDNKLYNKLKKKKKKKIFLTLNEEHLSNTFHYLNIIKDLNNYDKKEMLYVICRFFDFEKLSKRFSIYFNLNYNLNIFNRVINKVENRENVKNINVKAVYYLIKKCVNKKWKIQKRKKKKNNDMVFKYYSEKKLKYLNKTKEKKSDKTSCSNNCTIIINNSSIKKKINFLLKEALEIRNFFKIFYDEYIYKNKNRSYVRNLVKENFDICFLFMKFCFYYIQINNSSTVLNKLTIHNIIYLRQIDIIKKDQFIYHSICIPSCVHAFINILKINYKSEVFHSVENYKTFLLKFILYGLAYYKLKKNSYDFYTNKIKTNHICYFTRDIIINSIADLFEKKLNEKKSYGNVKKISKKENKALSVSRKCKKNMKTLKKIINSIDINIPPFIIINNIKTNWVYFKNYMILSKMCSYFKGSTYIYPNICFEIIMNFNSNSNVEDIFISKTEQQQNYFTLCFLPLHNIFFKNKIKKKKVLHFPFNHKLLKYFNDNILVKKKKNSYLLLNLLCNKFFNMFKKFLIYYKNKNYDIKVDFIFILLNYVMDIYYLMCYEKKKIHISNKKDFIITNDECFINEKIKVKENKIKKIIFLIDENNVIFNSTFFLWEDLKYKKKYSLKNKYIKYLEKHLFFSILCK